MQHERTCPRCASEDVTTLHEATHVLRVAIGGATTQTLGCSECGMVWMQVPPAAVATVAAQQSMPRKPLEWLQITGEAQYAPRQREYVQ